MGINTYILTLNKIPNLYLYLFLIIFNYKRSTMGINTYILTLNKNPILMHIYF